MIRMEDYKALLFHSIWQLEEHILWLWYDLEAEGAWH